MHADVIMMERWEKGNTTVTGYLMGRREGGGGGIDFLGGKGVWTMGL